MSEHPERQIPHGSPSCGALASDLYVLVYVATASKEARKLGRSPQGERALGGKGRRAFGM